MAVSNTIQLFLNLDINKNNGSQPEKLAVKIDVMKAIVEKIKVEARKKGPNSAGII